MITPLNPHNDRLSLTIDGQVHEYWDMYRVDSDLLKPADAWTVRVFVPAGPRPAIITRGALCRLQLGPDTIMTGRIDQIQDDVRRNQPRVLTLAGRDLAAVLVDCSAPIYSAHLVSMADIVAKVVKPLGIDKIKFDKPTKLQEKINVEPGDTAWQALQNACEANGVWAWMAPDGTLTIGGPRYDWPTVASLLLLESGQGNNVLSVVETQDLTHSFSEVQVLGQSGTGRERPADTAIKAVFKDPSVSYYRPKIVIDHDVTSIDQARERAKKLLQDSRLASYTVSVTVSGHRIDAPGQPSDGQPWQPGQRVHLLSEPHGIDSPFLIMGRQFVGGRKAATETILTLKEDGVWVTATHPHKRNSRRAKTAITAARPGQSLDLSGH